MSPSQSRPTRPARLFALGLACASLILICLTPTASAVDDSAAETTLQTPFYACFEPSLALRLAGEVQPDGSLTHWARERFAGGACLALPEGTQITHVAPVLLNGRYSQKFHFKGTSQWLYRADWAMEIGADGRPTPTQTAFRPMVTVTVALLDYAAHHMQCLIEVTDLNARVEAHNKEFLEEERKQNQDGTVTKTVIVFNPSDLEERGAKLNQEVAMFRQRCDAYRTLEASSDFVDMARERAGLPPSPRPTPA